MNKIISNKYIYVGLISISVLLIVILGIFSLLSNDIEGEWIYIPTIETIGSFDQIDKSKEQINELISLIKDKYDFKIIIAPGPSEINDAKDINALALLDNGRALDISQLTSLIKGSSFVIANDTGPAHITAHTGTKGLTLFGKHTTAYKVSIERENFKAIQVNDLKNLSAEKVFQRLTNYL